jgi:hypothetical protein
MRQTEKGKQNVTKKTDRQKYKHTGHRNKIWINQVDGTKIKERKRDRDTKI